MTHDRWQTVKQVFHQAVELEPAERSKFVSQACDGDQLLRSEVESLLSSHDEAGSFIAPPDNPAMDLLAADAETSFIGRRVGSYEILREIDRGGMGTVYLAARADQQFSKQVAIKLIRGVADSESIVRRFRTERQILANLDHPNIARLLDGGTTEDGVPYFIMEYIEGQPIDEYCDLRRLTTIERLKLFRSVCSAVLCAHQGMIVHRDIKPGNILVTADGTPKLLDFGIAKLLQPAVQTGHTTGTVAGVMTPEYASPEQARGEPITAASDIYSLGVLLYELLTGHRPYQLGRRSWLEIIQAICEQEPESPSTVVGLIQAASGEGGETAVTPTPDSVSQARASQPDKLRRQLEGDLDNIVLTAMRKEPHRRYSSVGQFSEDIRRYLEGLPVIARRDTLSYRTGKYIRRHKAAVFAAAIVALTLAVSAVGMRWEALVARRERTRAQSAAPFQKMNISRLTTTGKARGAAISPDGKYFVYVIDDGGKQSLWSHYLPTGDTTAILPPQDVWYWGLTFSKDGDYVYYVIASSGSVGVLYEVPALGGVSKKLISDVDTPVTFSPDESRMAFVRGNPGTGETDLMIANSDGSMERRIAGRKLPNLFFPPYTGAGPAWSPDGKMIAIGSGTLAGGFTVSGVRVADGKEERLTTHTWAAVSRVAWTSDCGGLVVSGADQASSPYQMWHVAYPGGEVRRITNDVNNYFSISLTADCKSLVTIERDELSTIWIAPGGDADRAREVQAVVSRYDGVNGICWTPDGRIVQSSGGNGSGDIWVVDALGTGRKQLTANAGINTDPSVTPDGRYIVFVSNRSGADNIWRMDIDGANAKQLTNNNADSLPQCSPDGKWVVYATSAQGESTLWKVPIEGGDSQRVTSTNSAFPAVSPDGTLIACKHWSDQPGSRAGWVVVPFREEGPAKQLQIPATSSFPDDVVRWAPDGRALMHIENRGGPSNVWSHPLDGRPPKQVTHFKGSAIFGFDWSFDGKQLALARGDVTRDVVLLKDLR